VTGRRHAFLGGFDGCHVEVLCNSEHLASELQARWDHLLGAPAPAGRLALRLTLDETAAGCELRDSTGCYQASGPIDYVFRHARKWMTALFASAHADLLWVHAAAATLDGAAVLLAGPAGSGKSTLVVKLIEQCWQLLGDDVIAIRPGRWEALPLPFSPEVRCQSNQPWEDARLFLERPKDVVRVPPAQVARAPAPIAAIVFPEYVGPATSATIGQLTVVSAAQALATQCAIDDRVKALSQIFRLSQAVPSYRLRYGDSESAAVEIASILGFEQADRKDRQKAIILKINA
jgi:hypothetical protein